MIRKFAACGIVVALVGLVATSGCGDTNKAKQKGSVKNAVAEKKGGADVHSHPEEGPHKGHLIELGNEEFHAELVHDEATHKVTFYILDSAAKQSVPISTKEVVVNYVANGKPEQVKIPAAPLQGEKEGDSSRFEIVSKPLCESICEDPNAKARLNVVINDKSYVGAIEHHEHGDHEHKK